ncbi:MAG: hypothetical protein WB661_11920 [Candidatus Bathyarchaeia archaeon]
MADLVRMDYTAFAYAIVGIVLYTVAIVTTFGRTLWERSTLGPVLGPTVMIISTSIAGLGAVVLGYLMIITLGGSPSLNLAKFISHVTSSKQIIEQSKTPPTLSRSSKILDRVQLLFVAGVVFISAVGLGWDVHNGDGPGAGMFQPLLHALDIFSRPVGVGPIAFSRQLIPALLVLTVIAGIVPALVLPYFDRIKVTGLNASPFHKTLLYYEVGALAGLGAILTLVGLFYRSLWLNRAPLPYHFGILSLLGFSLHFSLGMYFGKRKAEVKILERIRRSQSGRLIVLQ